MKIRTHPSFPPTARFLTADSILHSLEPWHKSTNSLTITPWPITEKRQTLVVWKLGSLMFYLFPYANLLRTLFNASCLPRRSTCYCGNKLVMQAEKVAPYKCDEECYSDKTKTCGGTKFFSMYQLHSKCNQFPQLFNDLAKFATYL